MIKTWDFISSVQGEAIGRLILATGFKKIERPKIGDQLRGHCLNNSCSGKSGEEMSASRYILKAEPIEFTEILVMDVGGQIKEKSKAFGLSNWMSFCAFY